MDGRPKPVQRPQPPLMIGGGGRRVLQLAAREANIVSLAARHVPGAGTDVASLLAPATAEKIGWVREAAGARFEELELNVYPSFGATLVTNDTGGAVAELAARLRERYGTDVAPDDLLEAPGVFIGSVDGLVEKFRGLRERFGITSIMVGDVDALAPVVERLAGT